MRTKYRDASARIKHCIADEAAHSANEAFDAGLRYLREAGAASARRVVVDLQ